MRNLRNFFTAAVMVTMLAFGTTFVNAGIIIRGRDGGDGDDLRSKANDPCVTKVDTKGTINDGIIIRGFGIIIRGFTGIIIRGLNEEPKVNCGIIIRG